jgi:hypothetical protein
MCIWQVSFRILQNKVFSTEILSEMCPRIKGAHVTPQYIYFSEFTNLKFLISGTVNYEG